MALSLLLTRTTGLVVPSTGLCSRPALTAPLARMQMVSDEEEWEELDGGDTSESWEEQMAAMREWEATKDSTPDPVAPAASESDPDDVASALADVGAAMVQLGRSVEVLAARLNGASPPPAASPASPEASQEQERVLLSSDELLSTVPAAVASLLEGRMVKSTSAPVTSASIAAALAAAAVAAATLAAAAIAAAALTAPASAICLHARLPLRGRLRQLGPWV